MPITQTRRRRANLACLQVQSGAELLKYKLMGPLTLARLEDIRDHFEMLKSIIDEGRSAINEAIWKTNTTPTRTERKRELAALRQVARESQLDALTGARGSEPELGDF